MRRADRAPAFQGDRHVYRRLAKIASEHQLNADLHSHSTASDGTLDAAALARRAKANGVELWALTDHDELRGLAAARAAARAAGLPFIDGIEISVTFAGTTVHIIGLGIDPSNDELVAGVAQVRAGRELRARQMGDGLATIGIQGAYEGAARLAPNPDLVSRTHFARFLVAQQLQADPQQQQAADDLQEGQAQQLGRHHRQHDAQHHGRTRAEEHRLFLLRGRQRAGGQRDHHRVVARKNDVDPDNLDEADPEVGALKEFHVSIPLLCIEKAPAIWIASALRLCVALDASLTAWP